MNSSFASPLLLFFNKTKKKKKSTTWHNSCTYHSDYKVRSFLFPIPNWLSDLIFSSHSLFASPIPRHLIWVQSPPHQLSACLPTSAPSTAVLTQPASPSYSRYQNPAQSTSFDKDVSYVTYFKLIK